MADTNGFKFTCPNCGQRLEAELDMIGMLIDCPHCGQPLEVPLSAGRPKIAVLKRRESLTGRWKNRLKAIGIGIALLCLFAGIGIIAEIIKHDENATETVDGRKENPGGRKEALWPSASVNKKVLTSVECLLDYLKLPNERRKRILSDSLQAVPNDFKDVVSEYLVSVAKNPDDMISAGEKEKAMETKAGAAILFGLLGAASTGDSQLGVNAGLELGDMAYAELREKARRRLRDEIERNRNRLVEVAQKYGINSNAFEEALVSHER